MLSAQAGKRIRYLALVVLFLTVTMSNCTPRSSDTPAPANTLRPISTPKPTAVPGTSVPADVPDPPSLTDTPAPTPWLSTPWYGIVRTSVDDWPALRENLGGAVVDLVARPGTPLGEIIASLDRAQAQGYRVIFHIYDAGTTTKKPWYLDNSGQWVFPQSAIDTLHTVSQHPAVFAVYALHEPLDRDGTYATVEQQQALYDLLKAHAGGLPVWTDIGGLSVWEQHNVPLADGMCDYCCVFPTHFRSDWTSEECLTETLRRIDADYDTQRRLMPNSQVVAMINTYAFADYRVPFRLPSSHEVDVIRDYLCSLGQPVVYYPWHHSSYDATLEDAPELWAIIAEGCDG